MNTCTQTLPLWAPLKNWTGRSGDSRSHQWRLVVDGNVAYHLTHNAGKSWNKFKKVRAPVPSRGLEPEWVGSTTKDLTNWSMISSRQTAACMLDFCLTRNELWMVGRLMGCRWIKDNKLDYLLEGISVWIPRDASVYFVKKIIVARHYKASGGGWLAGIFFFLLCCF